MSTENKQFTEKTAPEGYWIDAKGVLTPVSLIKDTDQMRDDLVRSIVEKATALSAALAEFKLSGFSDIGAFVDISASQYGVNLGGKKVTSRSTAMMAAIRFSVPCRTVSHLTSACRLLNR
jgi:hypothetical protein